MSMEDSRSFVAWEERILCGDRGRRLVHFYLRKASGKLMLSVIGTERSVRHMLYVATDELLQTCGAHRLIKKSSKWRSRREVLYLLNSLVSDRRMEDSVECLASSEQSCPRKLRSLTEEIKWLGDAWSCAKQLKHYSAFCRSNVTITVHSFAFILAEVDEGEAHYLGYLEDMYEDKMGLKKVRVRWFHLPNEESPEFNLHPREALITPQVQVISAVCVERPATVLTPKHFQDFSAAPLHLASPSEILLCSQQLENNKLRPFSIAKLYGYRNQEIVSLLKIRGGDGNGEDDDDLAHVKHAHPSGPRSQVLKPVRRPELRLKISKGVADMKICRSEPVSSSLLRVNEKIDVFCQDSGIRGCWFRCRILRISSQNVKVRYEDVMDVDSCANLEEWVPALRVANPDKLGMRCPGRKTIRPWPQREENGHFAFEIGSPVDAWWCDGWWEGVIVGRVSGPDKFQVYFPGEDRTLVLEKKCFRKSMDWVNDKWVEVKPKPGIISFLSSIGYRGLKLSSCCQSMESVTLLNDNGNGVPSAPEVEAPMDVNREFPGQTNSSVQVEEAGSSQ